MGKHERGYSRVERDLYSTPSWVVAEGLAKHLDLRGMTVWEPACGNGCMDVALRHAGCKCVFATDIVDHGSPQDDVLDFLSGETPAPLLDPIDLIVTNPPFGQGGLLATAFIEVGLRHITKPTRVISNHACLALLLPCDFDSAKTRARFFADCEHFVGKIVLTKRIVWFRRDDGVREAPKENHSWFIWQRSAVARAPLPGDLVRASKCCDGALRRGRRFRPLDRRLLRRGPRSRRSGRQNVGATMKHLTPIETRYRGYRFRSRLEARWGVFFQTLGVPWEYEPQGYKLSDGRWYLPDFRIKLADGVLWAEVKPWGVEADLLERFAEELPEGSLATVLRGMRDVLRASNVDARRPAIATTAMTILEF